MDGDPSRDIIQAWFDALTAVDGDVLRRLAHGDFVLDWPATGERMRGVEAAIAVNEAYPGRPDIQVRRVVGAEERWVVDALFTPRRIVGSGDVWTVEATMTYPDGAVWEYVSVVELQDGRVRHQTEYWAPRAEPPEWRRGLTERSR